jgi:hypothetical protein
MKSWSLNPGRTRWSLFASGERAWVDIDVGIGDALWYPQCGPFRYNTRDIITIYPKVPVVSFSIKAL